MILKGLLHHRRRFLVRALARSVHFLPANQQQAFLETISEQIQ
jgi:hypothetical protein